MAESVVLPGAAGDLVGQLALPPGAERGAAAVILCHGFPGSPKGALASGEGYGELAEFIADETGAAVLTFTFRGCGQSEGEFSLQGWVEDLGVAIDWLVTTRDVEHVGVAGFSAGGGVALCQAAKDKRVRSVAGFAVPTTFDAWSQDPRKFLDRCREVGVIKAKGFPEDINAWAAEFVDNSPRKAISMMGRRQVMLVHGKDDETVPVTAARELMAASGEMGTVDVRVLFGAVHRLRHDPRAIAILVGWASRLGPPKSDSE